MTQIPCTAVTVITFQQAQYLKKYTWQQKINLQSPNQGTSSISTNWDFMFSSLAASIGL